MLPTPPSTQYKRCQNQNKPTHDRNVLQKNVELLCSVQQILPYPGTDDLSLGDQLCRVELRHGGFEYFVSDGWEDTLVVADGETTGEISFGDGGGAYEARRRRKKPTRDRGFGRSWRGGWYQA
jgi:hypothetical protein